MKSNAVYNALDFAWDQYAMSPEYSMEFERDGLRYVPEPPHLNPDGTITAAYFAADDDREEIEGAPKVTFTVTVTEVS